jgi:uncharacterized protein (DUF1778 family)
MTVTARLELRIHPEVRARIQHAAGLAQVPICDFVLLARNPRSCSPNTGPSPGLRASSSTP